MSAEQEMFFLAILLRPLVTFPLFLVAVLLGRYILRKLPDGKLKDLLGREVGP